MATSSFISAPLSPPVFATNSQVTLVVPGLLVGLVQVVLDFWLVHLLNPILRADFFHRDRNRLFSVMQNRHYVCCNCIGKLLLLPFGFARPQLHDYICIDVPLCSCFRPSGSATHNAFRVAVMSLRLCVRPSHGILPPLGREAESSRTPCRD